MPFATTALGRLSTLSVWCGCAWKSAPSSSSPHTQKLPDLEYPGHFEVRYVSGKGGIRWNCHWVCVTHTLAGEYVGLEEVGDGLWDYFGPLRLGTMDERRLRIEDQQGRWLRKKVSPMSPD